MVTKIAVVGAGVIGVSSAYCLKLAYPEAQVTVISKDFSPNTTSDVAAGFWEPFLPGKTREDLVRLWSKVTYDHVSDIIKNDPTSALAGLQTTHGFSLSDQEPVQIPYWADIPYDFKVLSKNELKRFPDYIKSGFSFTTVFIESPRLIPWYSKKFVDLGGTFVQKEVKSLNELSGNFDIVVNCTGLGAKELVNDDGMFAIRGQVMRVKAPWVKEFYVYDPSSNVNEGAVILPNQDYIVLGGTKYEHDYNTNVDPDDRERILSWTQELVPSLKYAEHLDDFVGLRPARHTMRVEKEIYVTVDNEGFENKMKVVHNYGHGGSGLTVHWGCALDTVKLVGEYIGDVRVLKSKL